MATFVREVLCGNSNTEKYSRNFKKFCKAITKIEESVLLPEEI